MNEIWSDEALVQNFKSNTMLDMEGYSAYLRKYLYPIKGFACNDDLKFSFVEYVLENSMTILINKIKESSINPSYPLKIYVFAISTNFWLKILLERNLIEKVDPSQYVQFLIAFEKGEIETYIKFSNRFQKFWFSLYLRLKTHFLNHFFIVRPVEDIIYKKSFFNRLINKNVQVQCLVQALKGEENL